MIPVCNPKANYQAHKTAIDKAIDRVLDSGCYIGGNVVAHFENAFADMMGCQHAIAVGNGTEALNIALKAADIGVGDEVIIPALTATATLAAVECAGAKPILVDVDANDYTIDPNAVSAAITKRTRALIPVHLYGQPCDMEALITLSKQYGFVIIEDCAQAHGAYYHDQRVGSLGLAGCFSFYPTKNLGALGDGGIIISNDDQLAQRARQFREYGWNSERVSTLAGMNSRLDSLQAAILAEKLPHLDEANRKRQALADQYDEAFSHLPLTIPKRRKDSKHVFHLYVIACAQRDALRQFLAERHIQSAIHYAPPLHQQPAYKARLHPTQPLQHTEQLSEHILSLPLYPELSANDLATVSQCVEEFFKYAKK